MKIGRERAFERQPRQSALDRLHDGDRPHAARGCRTVASACVPSASAISSTPARAPKVVSGCASPRCVRQVGRGRRARRMGATMLSPARDSRGAGRMPLAASRHQLRAGRAAAPTGRSGQPGGQPRRSLRASRPGTGAAISARFALDVQRRRARRCSQEDGDGDGMGSAAAARPAPSRQIAARDRPGDRARVEIRTAETGKRNAALRPWPNLTRGIADPFEDVAAARIDSINHHGIQLVHGFFTVGMGESPVWQLRRRESGVHRKDKCLRRVPGQRARDDVARVGRERRRSRRPAGAPARRFRGARFSSARQERKPTSRRAAVCGFVGRGDGPSRRRESVAGAVGAVELRLVAAGEAADQRADPIGVGEREGRMVHAGADPVQRLGRRDRAWSAATCRGPAGRRGSARRSQRARPPARGPRQRPGCRARRAGRSCCRRRRSARRRARRRVGIAARRPAGRARRWQRAPAGARPRRARRAPSAARCAASSRSSRGRSARPDLAAQRGSRAAWMASGSTSRPISRATSASLGSCSDLGAEGRLAAAPRRRGKRVDERRASMGARASRAARGRPRSGARGQRLRRLPAVEGVGVVRSRNSRSLGRSGRSSSRTGAEKPRSSDGTGRARRRRRSTSVCCGLGRGGSRRPATAPPVSASTARSAPLRPTRPSATGMCSGFLSGWPGVGGQRLREVERVGLAAARRSAARR